LIREKSEENGGRHAIAGGLVRLLSRNEKVEALLKSGQNFKTQLDILKKYWLAVCRRRGAAACSDKLRQGALGWEELAVAMHVKKVAGLKKEMNMLRKRKRARIRHTC